MTLLLPFVYQIRLYVQLQPLLVDKPPMVQITAVNAPRQEELVPVFRMVRVQLLLLLVNKPLGE